MRIIELYVQEKNSTVYYLFSTWSTWIIFLYQYTDCWIAEILMFITKFNINQYSIILQITGQIYVAWRFTHKITNQLSLDMMTIRYKPNIETKGNCFASFQHKHCFRLLSVKVKFGFCLFLFFFLRFVKTWFPPILLKLFKMKLNTSLSMYMYSSYSWAIDM